MNFLVNMTITTTITALIILLIKRVFKNKMSATWQLYIWMILAIRILVPILPESDISIFNSVQHVQNVQTYSSNLLEPSTSVETVIEVDAQIVKSSHAGYNKEKYISDIILKLWIVGGITLFTYFMCAYYVFNKRVSKLPICNDEAIISILEKCKANMGIKKNVKLSIYGKTPMLKGIRNPTILLPDRYSNNDTEYILTHELCHLRHNDIAINILAILLLCIHWYNPVIWYCFFVIKKDLEILCDENAVKIVKNKKEYAAVLFRTALAKNEFIPVTTSMQNGKKDIKDRINFLATFKKPKFIWKILIVSAVVIGGIVCLTNAPKEEVWNVNANKLGNTIIELDDSDMVSLTEIAPFKWDKLYSFRPYTPKEEIYKIIGYEWDSISETVNEGMNQIVFTKKGKVVCYVYGYPSDNGYGLNLGTYNDYYIELNTKTEQLFKVKKSENITSLSINNEEEKIKLTLYKFDADDYYNPSDTIIFSVPKDGYENNLTEILNEIFKETEIVFKNAYRSRENSRMVVDITKETELKFDGGSTGGLVLTNELVTTILSFPEVDELEVLVEGEKDKWGNHYSFEGIYVNENDGEYKYKRIKE